MLNLLVGDFYLATSLRMVRSGYLMSNKVLEKQGFKIPIAKVLASVIDDGSWSTKSAEDVGLDEFHYHLVIIGFGGHGFNPFGDIVYPYQNIFTPKRWWKGAHEIYTPNIENFDYEDGV
jgi:hypothetical protein